MANASGDTGPIRSEFAGDPDMLELVQTFVDELPVRAAQLTASLEAGDRDGLIRLAHQLSGSCGGYGFASIGDHARRLERELNESDLSGTLAEVREQVDELVALCGRVVV
ncbi:MAG: Hpt domain-containing protein [Planctomycetota bacterium]